MDIYLPIAGLSVNALVIVGLGGLVGLLSGMFGVGGGFLTTPILIFYGIPPDGRRRVGGHPDHRRSRSRACSRISAAAASIRRWAG